LGALNLELFTLPSNSDFLRDHQDLLAKKRFNDRSKEFLFGQQPVKA
jgi:hypothetical protein